jgi:hypothetical protein
VHQRREPGQCGRGRREEHVDGDARRRESQRVLDDAVRRVRDDLLDDPFAGGDLDGLRCRGLAGRGEDR